MSKRVAREILAGMPSLNGRHLPGESAARSDGVLVSVVNPIALMHKFQHTLLYCPGCKVFYNMGGLYRHCGNDKASNICQTIKDDTANYAEDDDGDWTYNFNNDGGGEGQAGADGRGSSPSVGGGGVPNSTLGGNMSSTVWR